MMGAVWEIIVWLFVEVFSDHKKKKNKNEKK